MAMAYNGVDVSYAQGAYSPPANLNFVIVNASRANVGFAVGSYYHYQVDRTRQAGKEVGHYFFNGNIDATRCADFFVDNLYDFRVGDMLWLDVEAEPSSGTAAWNPTQALAFGNRVKARTGIMPGIYLNKSLENGNDWSACVNAGMRLWSAYYNGGALPAVRNWPEVSMIQWTSTPIDTNKAAYTQAAMAGSAAPEKKEEDYEMPTMIHRASTGEFIFCDDFGDENISVYKNSDMSNDDLVNAAIQGFKSAMLPDRVFDVTKAIVDNRRAAIRTAKDAEEAAQTANLAIALTPAIQQALSGITGGDGSSVTPEQITAAVAAALAGTKIQIDAGTLPDDILNAASKRLAA